MASHCHNSPRRMSASGSITLGDLPRTRWQRFKAWRRWPAVLMACAAFSVPAAAQQHSKSLEVQQLRCSALVAAIEQIPSDGYLKQTDDPDYFAMLRRYKPIYKQCMAVCGGTDIDKTCVSDLAKSHGVVAQYQTLLENLR